MRNLPPSGPGTGRYHWALTRTFQIRHLPKYIIGFVFHLLSKRLKLHTKTIRYLRHAMELGNPTGSLWPDETTPMVSRLLSGGVWNYTFFQFHRSYYFPYWAHKQYDPSSRSFIPRSHNVLSINQTQRNWVAISFPGKTEEISVDLAGAIMPGRDRFTIEMAIYEHGKLIRPHDFENELTIQKPGPGDLIIEWRGRELHLSAEQSGLRITGRGEQPVILSIRPFNMEGGVQIYRMHYYSDGFKITGTDIQISQRNEPEFMQINGFQHGDALEDIEDYLKKGGKAKKKKQKKIFSIIRGKQREEALDHIGLVTGAFYFAKTSEVEWFVRDSSSTSLPAGLVRGVKPELDGTYSANSVWLHWFPALMEMDLPGELGDWFSTSRDHILSLWDYDSITPGSFTYHEFWIRDAVVLMNSLLFVGGQRAVRQILQKMKGQISRRGLFRSQAGEWDANGQALWIIGRYISVSGDTFMVHRMRREIRRMILWIDRTTRENQGVLPPGFSAEHLGVADWYLWDNFWALGGMRELIPWQKDLGLDIEGIHNRLLLALDKYLEEYEYYPAALGRQRDAGMIGSVSAVYPLGLTEFMDERMRSTLEIIYSNYFYEGGFFQENIHSGVNTYLTLQVAEGFLATGDPEKALEILFSAKKWRSKTYTFPEAAHPRSRGGTMGDGFHGWAFAEVISLLKNFFFLEYASGFVLFAGVPYEWFQREVNVKNMFTPVGRLYFEITPGTIYISGLRKKSPKPYYISLPQRVKLYTSNNELSEVKDESLKILYGKGRVLYTLSLETETLVIRFVHS